MLQVYSIDRAHSQVSFTVRHLGFSKVRGRFERFAGTIRMAPEALHTLEAEVTIQTASINTGDEKRDEHLRSADFFEVYRYPELTFRSTDVKHMTVQSFTLVGELSMHGVTRMVSLAVEYIGEATDLQGGTRVAFEALTTINRKDFGLNWNQLLEAGGLLVSEEVEIALEIQAVLQGD